jgi:O-antigen ligase
MIKSSIVGPLLARMPRTVDAPFTPGDPVVIRAAGMGVQTGVLIQIAVCVIPAMVFVGFSEYTISAYLLFLPLGAFLAYHLLARRYAEAVTVAVGTIPATMLLRELFLYSSVPVILGGCLAATLLASRNDRERFMRNRPLLYFVSACFTYWLTSFVISGDYASNMRVVEFTLAAANVYILSHRRSYLATAFLGIAISALAMAGGLMPHGTRLGIVEGDDISIGNPISLGLSATLAFLLTIADGGRWLLLHKRPVVKFSLTLLAAGALILSTSRGSWLVTILGLLMILMFNKEGRKNLLIALALVTVLVAIIMQTERGAVIQHYVDNAVAADKTLEKRTTGRADQWEKFPDVFNDSPLWGFGPGSGKAVSLRYTKEGKPWHSLYLLIGTETGLIGLTGLALLLGTLLYRGVVHLRKCGEIAPLLGIVCLVTIGLTVSGIDSISGVFLGVAFLGADFSSFRLQHAGRAPEEARWEPVKL